MEIKVGTGIVVTLNPDGSGTIRFRDRTALNHIASTMALQHLHRASETKREGFEESTCTNRELYDAWWRVRAAGTAPSSG
jgi:hypothetical protein